MGAPVGVHLKDPAFPKFALFVNSLVPLALLGWDAWFHQLGANPTEFAIHITGMLTLIFVMLTLAVTPVRKITGYNWLSHFRRMLGLFAFFYGSLHLVCYVIFDKSGHLARVVSDVINRPFILLGMTALLLMAPLAVTSTNGMIKRLGAKRWKQLHRLVYPAAVAAVAHYWLFTKADKKLPAAFVIVLAMLLGYRLAANRFAFLRRRTTPLGVARTVSS